MFIKRISHTIIPFILLIIGYYYYIVTYFGYSGFTWNFSYVKFFESIAIIYIIEKLLPKKCNKPSDFLINVHYLLPILPMLVLYASSDRSRLFIYSVLIIFFIVFYFRNLNFINLRLRKMNQTLLNSLLFLVCIFYILLLFSYRGTSLNFNFYNIYDYRALYSEDLPLFVHYLSSIVSKVILPISVFLCIVQKRRFSIIVLLICSTLIFGYTQQKGPFFYPLFVIGLYNIMSKENIVTQLKFSYLILIIVGILLFSFDNEITFFITSVLFRRALFVPAEINFQYFEYFSTHPYIYWARNFFTFGLIDYPYDLPTAKVIGEFAYNNYETSASTGWIGSGFMQAGYIGLLLYSTILSLIMSILDGLAEKTSNNIVIAFTMIPMITIFASSDLPTSIITHGLLISIIIILYVSPKEHK